MSKLFALLAGLLLLVTFSWAESAVCHIQYGGEARHIEAKPTASPYTVPVVQVGSYFLFKLVFEERTAINIYVYADRHAGPLPLHQATFNWPVRNTEAQGFTGRHRVYEPVRDGELEYWCELN